MLNYARLKFATKVKEIKQLWKNEVGQFDICVTQIKTLPFKIETTYNLRLNCVYSSQQMEIRKLNRNSMEKLYVSKQKEKTIYGTCSRLRSHSTNLAIAVPENLLRTATL